MQKTVKVGLGQMLVAGGQLAENLGRATHMVHQAAEHGCQVVVLPECLFGCTKCPSSA